MSPRLREILIPVAASALVAVCGCGKKESKPAEASKPAAAPTATTTAAAADASAAQPAASGGADVRLHVTGAAALDVSGRGAGAFCAYYFPTERRGVSIQAGSRDFPGTGDWSLKLQGNSPAETGLLLSINNVQYSGNNGDDPARQGQGGKITVSDDVQHATFDMHLVNIVNHGQKIAVTGSIDCGAAQAAR